VVDLEGHTAIVVSPPVAFFPQDSSKASKFPQFRVCFVASGKGFCLPLLDGTVRLDIDDITNLVLSKVGVQGDHTLLAEVPAEGILKFHIVSLMADMVEFRNLVESLVEHTRVPALFPYE
jgi:hypothetical protein